MQIITTKKHQCAAVSPIMFRNAIHRVAGRALLPMLCVAGILLLSLGVEASGPPKPEAGRDGAGAEEADASPPFRWAQRKDRILLTIDLQVSVSPLLILGCHLAKSITSEKFSLRDKHTHTHVRTQAQQERMKLPG